MKPTDQFSRRQVLAAGTAATTFTIVPRHVLGGAGYTAPSAKLNIAGIGVGGMGTGDIQSVVRREHRGPLRRGQGRSGQERQAPPQGETALRLPQDAGDAEGHRRRRHRHAGPLPCPNIDDGHEDGQARALPEAADALGLRGPGDREGGQGGEGGHPDGQPGPGERGAPR